MKTILVVEDEYAIADMLSAVLEEAGYRVILAANGREGLTCLANEHTDLVLCDIMMPILDGREMVRVMKSDPALNSIPVVMMSAADHLIETTNVLRAGFLSKPFDLDLLLQMITRHISND